ncbi:MBL fold metallo-hydrolase [Ureibacillus sp. GCM10028918]|uniref:MBL fold metallo-hydrolase n=1 Tax=Ureibacillus sp. GCM10028918 TaxID=3273429 RepID=UPI0036244F63
MRKLKIELFIVIALLIIAGTTNNEVYAAKKDDVQTYDGLVIGDPIITKVNDKEVVSVELITQGKRMNLQTQAIDSSVVDDVTVNLVKGNLVDYKVNKNVVIVPEDPSETFNKVLAKGTSTDAQFDTMKYGPELSSTNGEAGNMVAAGWVYNKTKNTITVGDGRIVTEDISGRPLPEPIKRYEETYKVAKNVSVYNVNTENYAYSTVSDFESIPVTADYHYSTTQRQAVYVVFDRNYQQSNAAKVTSIYYFTPQSTSDGKPVWDVPSMSYLLKDKGIDPISGESYDKIRGNKPTVSPYASSTEPFEIVEDTFYYVGDNEVSAYLFHADMGTKAKSDDRLILYDGGWPYSGYQYWKNIEAVGFDPREITDIMLTHGHLDHYGTTVELINMIENAGGSVTLHGAYEEANGIRKDAMGNEWNIEGALPEEETEIRNRIKPYIYDEYMDFGNVQLLIAHTPGHTPGTTSAIFKLKNPQNGEWVSFGYMGGYGFNGLYTPTEENGYLRLGFQYGLAWLQQMFDVDYVAPQHTNQYPIIEIYQALKAYNNDPANSKKQLTMLDALAKDEFVNFLEKRYSVATNALSDLSNPNYQSIENYGPFKPGRENGLTDVKATLVDGGKIIQGYDSYQNVNKEIPLLEDGIRIELDSYTHDPDGWYVQFHIDVHDTYQGYLPNNGPVESVHRAEGTTEVLRTQRLNSKEEAEAILNAVQQGETYTISLTKASAIIVPDNVLDTFRSAE